MTINMQSLAESLNMPQGIAQETPKTPDVTPTRPTFRAKGLPVHEHGTCHCCGGPLALGHHLARHANCPIIHPYCDECWTGGRVHKMLDERNAGIWGPRS